MKTIGVVTTARSDYGIYLPLLRAIEAESSLALKLFVGGMHLEERYGFTVKAIEADGFDIAARVDMDMTSDSREGISRSIGLGVQGFAKAFAHSQPDLLVVLGDRFEMLSAAVAALPFNIPIAHIHGGESTEGLIDEAIRHSLTKMSHLHFVSTGTYANRVIQMGEDPRRVVVSGAPGLDNIRNVTLLTRDEIKLGFGLDVSRPFLLVTYHPVTLEPEHTVTHIDELISALDATPHDVLFTYPNADTESRKIVERIEKFCARNPKAKLAVNLGTQGYFSVMSHALAMVGNSSSGIIEAASFKLPVINIGNRQRGRVCGKNVLHCGTTHAEILNAIFEAISPDFAAALADLRNPYGDGNASERIVKTLREAELGPELLMKRFHELHF